MKPIPNFPNYKITSDGRLYSVKKKKFVKDKPGGFKKYIRVELWKNGQRYHKWVHRLVCEVWVGCCEGLQVHHLNGNPTDNRAANLKPLTFTDHLEATRKLRLKQAKQRAEKLKADCPF